VRHSLPLPVEARRASLDRSIVFTRQGPTRTTAAGPQPLAKASTAALPFSPSRLGARPARPHFCLRLSRPVRAFCPSPYQNAHLGQCRSGHSAAEPQPNRMKRRTFGAVKPCSCRCLRRAPKSRRRRTRPFRSAGKSSHAAKKSGNSITDALGHSLGSAADAPEKGVNGAAPAHGPLAHPVLSTGCALPYGLPEFFKSDRAFGSLNRRKRGEQRAKLLAEIDGPPRTLAKCKNTRF
jgi:hypothetical protein